MIRAVIVFPLALLAGCGPHVLAKCDGTATALVPGAAHPMVWDNGNSTFLRFPGNIPIPAISTVDDAGKEAPAEYTVQQDGTVMLHEVAREVRLRSDDRVACLVNDAFDLRGTNPGTGTTTAHVIREPREARR